MRHSHRKRGETDRPRLRSTAPALDPTRVGLDALHNGWTDLRERALEAEHLRLKLHRGTSDVPNVQERQGPTLTDGRIAIKLQHEMKYQNFRFASVVW